MRALPAQPHPTPERLAEERASTARHLDTLRAWNAALIAETQAATRAAQIVWFLEHDTTAVTLTLRDGTVLKTTPAGLYDAACQATARRAAQETSRRHFTAGT